MEAELCAPYVARVVVNVATGVTSELNSLDFEFKGRFQYSNKIY